MLTLEERERHAYISNSPDHPVILLAIEAENDALDEMRHERDLAKDESKYADEKVQDLEGELELAETKIQKLETEVEELEEKIHESGVDLVV